MGEVKSNTHIPARKLRLGIVNKLVTFLLSVEGGKPCPPFAIETDLTKIPHSDYPRLSLPELKEPIFRELSHALYILLTLCSLGQRQH